MPLTANIRKWMAWPVPMLMPHTIIACVFGYFAGSMPELEDEGGAMQLPLLLPFVYVNLLHCLAIWVFVVAWYLSIGSFLQPIETQILHRDVLWYFTWRVIFFLTQTHGDNALLWLIHLGVYCTTDMMANLLTTRLKHTPQTSRYPGRAHSAIGIGLLSIMYVILHSMWILTRWSWSGVCEPIVAVIMFCIVGIKTLQGLASLWGMYRTLVFRNNTISLQGQPGVASFHLFELVKEGLYCILYALLVAYLAFFMNIYSSGLSLSVSPGSLITAILLRQSIQRFSKLRQQRNNYVSVLRSLSDSCRLATPEELGDIEDNCAICWEAFSVETSGVQRLPCRHFFHTACLISWMEHDITCPTCRHSLLENPVDRPLGDHRAATAVAAGDVVVDGEGGEEAAVDATDDVDAAGPGPHGHLGDGGDGRDVAAVGRRGEEASGADDDGVGRDGLEARAAVDHRPAAADHRPAANVDHGTAQAAVAGTNAVPQQAAVAGTNAMPQQAVDPRPPGRTFVFEGSLALRFLPRINFGLVCTINGNADQRITIHTNVGNGNGNGGGAGMQPAPPQPPTAPGPGPARAAHDNTAAAAAGAGTRANAMAAAARRPAAEHRPAQHQRQPAVAAAAGEQGSPAAMATTAAGGGAATGGVPNLQQVAPHVQHMVQQVHAMFPQFSMVAITGDIIETQDVEETVNNILDGRVPASMLGMGGGDLGSSDSGFAQSLLGNALAVGGLRPAGAATAGSQNRVQRFPATPSEDDMLATGGALGASPAPHHSVDRNDDRHADAAQSDVAAAAAVGDAIGVGSGGSSSQVHDMCFRLRSDIQRLRKLTAEAADGGGGTAAAAAVAAAQSSMTSCVGVHDVMEERKREMMTLARRRYLERATSELERLQAQLAPSESTSLRAAFATTTASAADTETSATSVAAHTSTSPLGDPLGQLDGRGGADGFESLRSTHGTVDAIGATASSSPADGGQRPPSDDNDGSTESSGDMAATSGAIRGGNAESSDGVTTTTTTTTPPGGGDDDAEETVRQRRLRLLSAVEARQRQ